MKASEVIEQLARGIAEHGDLECTVQDGHDPSDPHVVTEVKAECDTFFKDYGHRHDNILHFHLS